MKNFLTFVFLINKILEKRYNFIYKTTNLINGKYYIGVRSTNIINDGYIGCGIKSQAYVKASKKYGHKSAFHDAVLKYGYENFKREILFFTKTRSDAFELEELIVDHDFINNKETYNISIGGKGGRNVSTTPEFDKMIFEQFMSGKSKKELKDEFGVKYSLLWRIIRDRDRSNKNININHNIKLRKNIEKWVIQNGENYIKEFVKGNISKRNFDSKLPFDLGCFNLLENIERNKKYCCILENKKIYFDTEKEISEILNTKIFRAGYISVIENKSSHYKGYIFRRTTDEDFKDINYNNHIEIFLKKIWESLNDLKFNNNRGIIKK